MEYAQLTRRGQIQRMRQIARHALAQYGFGPDSLSLLDHAYNTTFALTAPGGVTCVLHILRPEEDRLSESQRRVRVESELWWLDRVRAELDLPVPVPVRTPDGAGVVSVGLKGTEPARLCTLVHWLDGRFVRHRLTPAHLHAVGCATARLHDASAQLHVPDWFDRPEVDRADAEREENTVHLFTDHVSPDAADVVRRVLQRVRQAEDVLGGAPDTFGLIHADIHQRNYLFRGREVCLIDFGDCGWGHYLYDLAVTLSEVADLPLVAGLRAGLLAGYRQVRDLSRAEEGLIDSFVMLREVQNLTWFVTARDDPSYRHYAARVREGVVGLAALLPSPSGNHSQRM